MTRDRRKLDRRWRKLGGNIVPISKTGEVRYGHPLVERTVRVSKPKRGGRVPESLIKLIRDVEQRE